MPPSGDTVFRRRASSLTTISRVAASFLVLIAIGAVLLSTPWARLPGVEVSWVDSLFLATSATCVTGLTTVNVGETYTPFGQGVILAMIQLGGLGITTAGTLFLVLRRGGSSLASEDFIGANVGSLRQARPVDIFIYATLLILAIEWLGIVALTYLLLEQDPGGSFGQVLWEATFHGVSAFCNAGLSIYPEGLIRWKDQSLALGVVCALVILGGIGFLTMVNFRYYYPWRRDRLKRGRLTLQTRICIGVSSVLLLSGTLLCWLTERDQTLREVSWARALLWSFFHSTMTRTAGFNVVNNGEMTPETLLGSLVLMFIGGCPGSMAGGIKVTTLVLLGAVTWSALRRRSELTVGRYTVPADQAGNAVMVTLLSAVFLLIAIGALFNVEARHDSTRTELHWIALIFEAVSAFSTVGLSTGITPLLTPVGKGIIIVLMFVGRLGPLCLAMHLARPAQPDRVSYPRENVTVG